MARISNDLYTSLQKELVEAIEQKEDVYEAVHLILFNHYSKTLPEQFRIKLRDMIDRYVATVHSAKRAFTKDRIYDDIGHYIAIARFHSAVRELEKSK